jgi:hypothetical protein
MFSIHLSFRLLEELALNKINSLALPTTEVRRRNGLLIFLEEYLYTLIYELSVGGFYV